MVKRKPTGGVVPIITPIRINKRIIKDIANCCNFVEL